MLATRYSPGNEILCAVGIYGLHHECPGCSTLRLHWNDIMVVLHKVMFWLCYDYIIVMLWLLLQQLYQLGERLCYGCHASQEGRSVCAVPMALLSLLLAFKLTPCLPWVQWTVRYSETIGTVNGISNTTVCFFQDQFVINFSISTSLVACD